MWHPILVRAACGERGNRVSWRSFSTEQLAGNLWPHEWIPRGLKDTAPKDYCLGWGICTDNGTLPVPREKTVTNKATTAATAVAPAVVVLLLGWGVRSADSSTKFLPRGVRLPRFPPLSEFFASFLCVETLPGSTCPHLPPTSTAPRQQRPESALPAGNHNKGLPMQRGWGLGGDFRLGVSPNWLRGPCGGAARHGRSEKWRFLARKVWGGLQTLDQD